MKTTAYFELVVLPKRPFIRRDWCKRVIANPIARVVQRDGRVRLWGRVPEFGNRALRVILLPDGETVHNAYFDRRFVAPNTSPEGWT